MTFLTARDYYRDAYSRTLERERQLLLKLSDVAALHESIIDQGRKVLNATSDKGLSKTDFIEWALERLEGK